MYAWCFKYEEICHNYTVLVEKQLTYFEYAEFSGANRF